jgi:hypothetical protein
MSESNMAAMTYSKGDWIAEADIKPLSGGAFQGIVQVIHRNGSASDEVSQHLVDAASDSPEEALEEAKALAHRILGDL